VICSVFNQQLNKIESRQGNCILQRSVLRGLVGLVPGSQLGGTGQNQFSSKPRSALNLTVSGLRKARIIVHCTSERRHGVGMASNAPSRMASE
jgi:hypothetical protein